MSWQFLSLVWWTWDVLCWGDRLTAGFADVLRQLSYGVLLLAFLKKLLHLESFSRNLMSQQSSRSEFWAFWPQKMPASGWGSLWELSSFVPWFSAFLFRNVPGTVSECVVICWFKRNSFNLDRASEMQDSILLNSWDSFLVTLPSISSESCVISSSLILGTDVFRDWPFLGFSSCVSLVTAANFRLFLNVVIFLKGKCYAVMKTELFCIC